MKNSVLSVNIVDAFEVGRIQGSRDIIAELLELAILDDNFQIYLKIKLKSIDEKLAIINHYKLLFSNINEE